jgi:hypothetical protein
LLTEVSVEALAEGILGVLRSGDRREELAGQTSRAVERFSIRAATQRLLEAYQQAIETKVLGT